MAILSAKEYLKNDNFVCALYKLTSSDMIMGRLYAFVAMSKMPDKLKQHYVSVLDRVKTHEFIISEVDAKKSKRLARYDDKLNCLIGNEISVMNLIGHCYKANKTGKLHNKSIVWI